MPPKKYDIDTYLDPITPQRFLHHLPRPISHFLGYRPPSRCKAPSPRHPLVLWMFSFLGAFCGVALIEAVYMHLPQLDGHTVPIVMASFGAAAILEYNTIESPLAQPRNLILGQVLSAAEGVGIAKLFQLLPASRFNELEWVAGALAVGIASLVMSVTKTVHPPAGATALITVTTAEVRQLGWWAVALALLGSLLMLASALILNNIARQFPLYWWTPTPLPVQRQGRSSVITDITVVNDHCNDVEKAGAPEISESDTPRLSLSPSINHGNNRRTNRQSIASIEIDEGSSTNTTMLASLELSAKETRDDDVHLASCAAHEIVISTDRVTVPECIELDDYEKTVLAVLQQRVRRMSRTG
ncbi:hypothetical protein DV735_g2990, partial [Chaetothyriales sp. CBS 134920]